MIHRWQTEGRYKDSDGPENLAKDFAKMFYNAELYNSADSEIWKTGALLESFVQSQFKKFTPCKFVLYTVLFAVFY